MKTWITMNGDTVGYHCNRMTSTFGWLWTCLESEGFTAAIDLHMAKAGKFLSIKYGGCSPHLQYEPSIDMGFTAET